MARHWIPKYSIATHVAQVWPRDVITLSQAVLKGVRLADHSAQTEVRGFTKQNTRPADILTNAAVPGRSVALDICVAGPQSIGAAGAAVVAARGRKLKKYAPVKKELHEAGVTYMPMVWTSNGRLHPAATRVMRYVASLASDSSEQDANAKSVLKR